MDTLVAYISGHGFGHASRSIEVLNALARQAPDLRLVARSSVASWLFTRTADPRVELQPRECDTGAVQIDSLHIDEAETVRRAIAFMDGFEGRVAAESSVLEALGATVVLADIPALGIAAATCAGVPAVAMSNFTWDWIYAAYEGGADVAHRIGEAYASAGLALRLPLAGGFETFPRVEDIPFVARRSRRDPREVRRAFDLPADARVALVSFGGYGVDGINLEALSVTPGWLILATGTTPFRGARLRDVGPAGSLVPLDEPAMYARGFRYEDIVGAVDVVVSKPGYGIIAECVANDTAILYTSRGHFREYDVLVAGMPHCLRARFIGHNDLFAGRWAPHLDALVAQPAPPERPRVDGAELAAERVLEALGSRLSA